MRYFINKRGVNSIKFKKKVDRKIFCLFVRLLVVIRVVIIFVGKENV